MYVVSLAVAFDTLNCITSPFKTDKGPVWKFVVDASAAAVIRVGIKITEVVEVKLSLVYPVSAPVITTMSKAFQSGKSTISQGIASWLIS